MSAPVTHCNRNLEYVWVSNAYARWLGTEPEHIVGRSIEEIFGREGFERVRGQIGPVAAFKLALVVKRLHKTRSGKILRGTMKRIADGAEYAVPATNDDPAILGEIGEALKTADYPRGG